MAIKVYKFNYEVTPNYNGKLIDNYVDRAKNHIIESINNPDFVFPKYYRVSVTYTPIEEIDLDDKDLKWNETYAKLVNGEEQGSVVQTFRQLINERYTYNNRDIPLEYPETHVSDREGLDDFHPIETSIMVRLYDKRYYCEDGYNKPLSCSAIVTYSDDDSSAGDRYVEPEPRKKIYLANLDFGYRRSRRNNKNRRKYRKYRNRF